MVRIPTCMSEAISIHAPLAGSDNCLAVASASISISIHAPLAGSDTPLAASWAVVLHFDPRSPCGERHVFRTVNLTIFQFRSTLPLRGATDLVHVTHKLLLFRSTLPLRGATIHRHRGPQRRQISIHAPLAGSDNVHGLGHGSRFISIHAPLAGSDVTSTRRPGDEPISIHAPLAGSDVTGIDQTRIAGRFRSTLPLRGATSRSTVARSCRPYFDPRSPCGERRLDCDTCVLQTVFRSTLPLRGATYEPTV